MLDIVTRSQAQVLSESQHKDTLSVTMEKQNLRLGLTHITDDCYEFFHRLCSKSLDIHNMQSLHQHGENLHGISLAQMLSDMELFEDFYMMFCTELPYHHRIEIIVHSLFSAVVKLFLATLTDQLRKDFLGATATEKKAAHRKQILKRKQSLNFDVVIDDNSHMKSISHNLLIEFIKQNSSLPGSFTKANLQVLCLAYNIAYVPQELKRELAEKLVHGVPKHLTMLNTRVFQSTCTSTGSQPKKVTKSTRPRSIKKDICRVCRKGDTDDSWIFCNTCHYWYHRMCEEIFDDEEWDSLQNTTKDYRCNFC